MDACGADIMNKKSNQIFEISGAEILSHITKRVRNIEMEFIHATARIYYMQSDIIHEYIYPKMDDH